MPLSLPPPNGPSTGTSGAGPAGPAGPPGPAGPTGPQGPAGATGPAGAAGATGAQGPKGDTGATGPASTVPGPAGPTGPTGATGPQGPVGPAGQAEAWYSGPGAPAAGLGALNDWYLNITNGDVYEKAGVAGEWVLIGNIKGPTGAAGAQGVKGDTGAAGATGAQGPQGVKGDTGAAGATGAAGTPGATGAQGPQGVKGDTGAQGPQGVKGDTGATGATGPQGPAGAATPLEWMARQVTANTATGTAYAVLATNTALGASAGMSYSNSTGRITIATPGTYEARLDLTLTQTGGGGNMYTETGFVHRRGGTAVAQRTLVGQTEGPGRFGYLGMSFVFGVLAGDTVEPIVASQYAGILSVENRSYFNVKQIA